MSCLDLGARFIQEVPIMMADQRAKLVSATVNTYVNLVWSSCLPFRIVKCHIRGLSFKWVLVGKCSLLCSESHQLVMQSSGWLAAAKVQLPAFAFAPQLSTKKTYLKQELKIALSKNPLFEKQKCSLCACVCMSECDGDGEILAVSHNTQSQEKNSAWRRAWLN